jgi:hypothetical protein
MYERILSGTMRMEEQAGVERRKRICSAVSVVLNRKGDQ